MANYVRTPVFNLCNVKRLINNIIHHNINLIFEFKNFDEYDSAKCILTDYGEAKRRVMFIYSLIISKLLLTTEQMRYLVPKHHNCLLVCVVGL